MKVFYPTARWVLALLFRGLGRLQVEGAAKIPATGRLILASNHVSGWDPLVIGVAARRELFYLAKKELFESRLLRPLLRSCNAVPIDRARVDLSAMRTVVNLLQMEKAVVLFPEGTRSRNGVLGDVKEGVGLLAIKGRADILPVYIQGTQRLARSMKGAASVRVVFGDPIRMQDHLNAEGERQAYRHIAHDLQRRMVQLQECFT